MSSSVGLDLMRGRPTPAIGTTAAKLQQRKLDALKRGVHLIGDITNLPFGVQMIGVGGAGSAIVERILASAPDDLLAVDGSRLTALAIDIVAPQRSVPALARIDALRERFRADRSQIETIALPMPAPEALLASLRDYREFLRLESPLHRWSEPFEPWLDPAAISAAPDGSVARAVAKAVYGQAYYAGARPGLAALKRFAASVDATRGEVVVCIVFALDGGTGSGIALDLARHLSNGLLGRRVLVTGIGVLPCDGDGATGSRLFPVLSELDCLCDETKNAGLVMSCGDLYRNPFTAGFVAVPQQHVWSGTLDLEATHARVDREIASLMIGRRGANLWEMLRLLNWVAAPSTQHSAARTPWGAEWLHVLGFADAAGGKLAITPATPAALGLRPDYRPEFLELRIEQDALSALAGTDAIDTTAAALADQLDAAFCPDVPPQVQFGAPEGSVQFVLPRVAKTELGKFRVARDIYDAAPADRKLLDHALLLEQGVVLCEPSTVLDGMAGASLPGHSGWVAVPMSAIRGETADDVQTMVTSDAA